MVSTSRSAADDSDGVKQRILRAAIGEFALTGYHLTSLRTISERSGSNKPMIYYHFRSKDGLYRDAVRLQLEEMAGSLGDTTWDDAPAMDQLRRFAEIYLDAFLTSLPLLGTVLRELEGLPVQLSHAIVEEYSRLVGARLRRILASGVERGDFRRLDMDGCVGGVIAILHGFVRGHHPPAEHVRRVGLSQLMDYYALGLLSPAALDTHLREQQTPARR